MRNKKGETLVEAMVSMAMLATILVCVAVIIMYTTRATSNALDTISATNNAVSIYNAGNFPGTPDGISNITLTFTVKNNSGDIIAENRTYTVGQVETRITAEGFVLLGEG